jgi:hypothetical protein
MKKRIKVIKKREETPTENFMFYPDITDPDFYKKIYSKKEFHDYSVLEKETYDVEYHKPRDFTLQPFQNFLKNYISPDTPYNGIIIYHGTGVGKTCSAITIAEGFKRSLKSMKKKVLILSNLQNNFYNELYGFIKEMDKKNPDDIVQCTKKEYELGYEYAYLTKEQREKKIRKNIKSYYQIFGYKKFANEIIEKTGGWKGDEKDLNPNILKFISREFDERVIIIDEIQNIKTDRKEELTKSIQNILQMIIKYGSNIKLILMSATPMFDRPDEIIFYINLLLLNDRRPILDKNKIFDPVQGTLKEGAEEILRNIFQGYVSYIRSEKPFVFPFRIHPKECQIPLVEYSINGKPLTQKIEYTPLLLCPMREIQYETYIHYLDEKMKTLRIQDEDNIDIEKYNENETNKKHSSRNHQYLSLLFHLYEISNIVYPIVDTTNKKKGIQSVGIFGKESIESNSDNGMGGYYRTYRTMGKKNIIKYKYQSHAIFDKDTPEEAPFADEKHLYKYSTKFAQLLDIIKKSKGLIFIFSQFIYEGTLPIALMLEQNGFSRECYEGETPLLDYASNKYGKGRRNEICYLCSHGVNHVEHTDRKNPNYHEYSKAKYILYSGKADIVKVPLTVALDKYRSQNNKYGKEIKIFIGTRKVSEGLDFKYIRQIHIMDPWYNLSRHEQIIGRAIRQLSHIDLKKEERNVEVFQYAAMIEGDPRESIDLRNYRIAEEKDIIIKKISRIMKETAIDCYLFKNINQIDTNLKVKQITARGEEIVIPVRDIAYSPMCDYQDKCAFACKWEPNPRDKLKINADTYRVQFSSNEIDQVKKQIKYLFRIQLVYTLKDIEENLFSASVQPIFIYNALEELANNKNEIVYDKFGKKGYIIYRGEYYIFQPYDFEKEDVPMNYRVYPLATKKKQVDLESVHVEYAENKKVEQSSTNNNSEYLYYHMQTLFETEHAEHLRILSNNAFRQQYDFAVFGALLNSFTREEEKKYIEYIFQLYLTNLRSYSAKKEKEYILPLEYLESQARLIYFYNDIKVKKVKKDIAVGFILYNEYYILSELCEDIELDITNIKRFEFVLCKKYLMDKIRSLKNIENSVNNSMKYPIVYGQLEYDIQKMKKTFKIVDKTSEEDILTKQKTKSKRTEITGRMCYTYNFGKLMQLRDVLKMYSMKEKPKIEFLCMDIHIYLLFKSYTDNKRFIWFESNIV